MADKKISGLTSLAQGDVAVTTDVLPIVDTSATETKKVTAAALVGAGLAAGVTSVDINSGAIDGTTIGASSASTGSFTTLTTSSTVTLNGGTANGVLYLNGSKVATSGSALTFDGTDLLVGGTGKVAFQTTGGSFDNYIQTNSGLNLRLFCGRGSTSFTDIASDSVRFGVNAAEQMRLTSTGLGIGTSSPLSKLNAKGTQGNWRIDPDSVSGEIQLLTTTVANDGFRTYRLRTYEIAFDANGTERMRLDASGNLGIGTSSPAAKLQSVNTSGFTLGLSGSTKGIRVEHDATRSIIQGVDNTLGASYQPIMISGSVVELGNSGVVSATLNASGNLGLGVTPSAWGASWKAIQLGGGGSSLFAGTSTASQTYLTANSFFDGTNFKYVNTAAATYYGQVSGEHRFFNAASGTAGNTISFTQAMTLDASGNLGVGTTSPGYRIHAVTTDGYAARFTRDLSTDVHLDIGADNDGAILQASGVNVMRFFTGTTEKARITSGGNFLIGETSGTELLNVKTGDNGTIVAKINAAGTGYFTQVFQISCATASGTGFNLIQANNAGGECFKVRGDGNAYNTNGTYGTISDERLKQNIVAAPSQWNDIKAVQFRKYRLKADVEANPNAQELLGVVAQELEQTSPGLVDEGSDGIKSVKTSVLLMKAAVALQEAMARIEKLEAEVAALKGV